MYDLHTHTTMTDGEMLPIEIIRRMAVLGYTEVAITDHADPTNLATLLPALERLIPAARAFGITLLPGVEITHVPPPMIPELAREAKRLGARIVVVHGETPMEPVAPGTNLAACRCEHVDVLAHPGLITGEEAESAREHGVALELTSRGGHNRTNGHVAHAALAAGCEIVINSDAHAPGDLLDARAKNLVGRGAGLTRDQCDHILSLNIVDWVSGKK
ncbi:MAG: histidinol phosphate phosphatase domain-containing protein [Methanolinea sp.]|nr:histidinol phosphate phosphatase domain-containing protein [Methanolinea sp.]